MPSADAVADAIRRLSLGRATPADNEMLTALGLTDTSNQLTPDGTAIEDAFWVFQRPEDAHAALRRAYAHHPVVEILLQALQGKSAVPITGVLHLLEKHQIVSGRPDDLRKLRAALLALNPYGLLKYSPRKASVNVVATADVSPSSPMIRVIQPDRPYSNIRQLRDTLRQCSDYIWWVEPHFPRKGLEPLADEADGTKVSELRILSGPANADAKGASDFGRFQQEMTARGISATWRVVTPPPTHDRYIITKHHIWNVPPINTIYKGDYCEILETTFRPPFDVWWKLGQDLS